MDSQSPSAFVFENFRLDEDRLELYYGGEPIKDVDRKSLELLSLLLQNAGRVVRYDDIIEEIWHDNPHGATPARVNQYVSRMQKVFARHEPECKFIENIRGRGYVFTGSVTRDDKGNPAPPATRESRALKDIPSAKLPLTAQKIGRSLPTGLIYGAVIAAGIIAVLASYSMNSAKDEDEVKRVVKESQLYESLVLYKDPKSFKESDLDKYWTTELDLNSNYDRKNIRTGARKLLEKGLLYGNETKCEQFDFQSVEINAEGNMAVVKTLEKWFLAIYQENGTLKENKYVGPYFVSYVLRKIDGRWLIEKSNTGRANSPSPKLTAIKPVTTIAGGQQFFVDLKGEGFLPEIVNIKVVGEGCPEANPCTVPNSALRQYSSQSEAMLENVPLTLASGNFLLFAQNGESPPSNSMNLIVP